MLPLYEITRKVAVCVYEEDKICDSHNRIQLWNSF